jgi:catechol 2,3-dioxygenase
MEEKSLPDATHIGYADFIVADLQRALDFYQGRLGFHEVGREDSQVILSADQATPHIVLSEKRDALPKPPRSTGLYHVAIRYPSRVTLARAFRRLIETRWPFGGFSDHAVSEALYLADPDGNGLEMYRDRPREEWPMANGQIQMTTDPLDVDDLLAQADLDPSPWSGVDAGTDIGHVHLHVSDLNRAKAFYHALIGLDIAFDMRNYGALFLSAGGYHHHLGLNTWGGKTPPPANVVGLQTWQLVIPDADALAGVIQRLKDANVAVEQLAEGGARAHDYDNNTVDLVVRQA